MKKIACFVLALLITAGLAARLQAQTVSSYNFTSTTGNTYTALDGTATTVSGVASASGAFEDMFFNATESIDYNETSALAGIPIGFDFLFDGKTYDKFVIGGIGDFFVNLFVIVLLLYFLLAGGRDMESYVKSILPFSEHNKKDVMEKVNVMVRSNTIGIPLLAIIQGMIAWIGFMLFDVPNAFLAAFLTGIASVIPVVGTAIVWLPLSVYFVVIGEWVSGICMLAFGAIIISQCDNLIRFILQKKMANTHPLITLFGVIAGLPIFGFMGIIFGPLLVSLFLLFLDMFRNEYLIERNPAPLQDESESGESAVQERD